MQKLKPKSNKKLSQKTVRLLRGSVLAKYNWKTIFYGHYRSIFNHWRNRSASTLSNLVR